MKKIKLAPLTICLILVIVLVISALTLADTASETNKKAEQRFERANELLKRMDYEAAIAEYKEVLNISSDSKIAQDAQYWIGQTHFRAGQFDAAQSTFAKLIEAYPTSAIVPVTKLMIGQVRQAKKNEEIRRAISNASDKGYIIDPDTGVKYTKIATFTGKNDVIGIPYGLNLSPNGKFLLSGKLVVPLDGSEPFDLVDMPAYRGSWSPDGKKVAFYSGDAICMVPVSPGTGRPTGPVRKLLDGDYKLQLNVSWSPDSERIVFVRSDKENRGIWTLSVRDGTLTQITDAGYGPAWSPDGKSIAYGKGFGSIRSSIWLCPAEGGASRKIAEPGGWFLFWSADGKWILYKRGAKIHLLHLADEQKLEIVPPRRVVGRFFSWSPDGKRMLFYRSSYDYKFGRKVVSASGGPPLEIGRQIQIYGSLMVWSPDSKTISMQGANKDGVPVWWIIPLSGDDPFVLEMDVSVDGSPFPFAVSPNVKKLAFAVERDDGTKDVFVVPISLKDARTTGPAVKVFHGLYRGTGSTYDSTTSWSPDGNKLAVIHKDDVWIASSNGDKPVQITKTPGSKAYPGWSPDGKMINYVVRSGKDKGDVYVVSASGDKVIRKLEACWYRSAWSPDSKELAVVSNGLISIIPVAGGETQQIAKLKDLGLDEVLWLRWSPDGKYIACVGNHTVKGLSGPICVIPVEGGKPTMLVTDDDSSKYLLSWSPDGKWIAYNSERDVKVRPEGTMWEADFEQIVKKASR
ncbi:MAG: tetratricopeptide repeat protein [Planctomycetota bacterium]